MSEFFKRAAAFCASKLARPASQSAVAFFLALLCLVPEVATADGIVHKIVVNDGACADNPTCSRPISGVSADGYCLGDGRTAMHYAAITYDPQYPPANPFNYSCWDGVGSFMGRTNITLQGGKCYITWVPLGACKWHASCPPRSAEDASGNCVCERYWVSDAYQESCVFNGAACPANSTPTDSACICNDRYVWDTAGTSCVLQPSEDLTIALPGLEDTVTVMPGQTLSTYAQVTKSDGSAKSGVWVWMVVTAVPDREDQLLSAYTGTLSANTVSVGSTVYSGDTGTDGRLSFVFTAPQVGSTHTIYAICMGPSCTNYAEEKIKVPGCPVPVLKDLPADDACAQSLNKGLGKDVDGKCPKLDERLPGQMQCFAGKIAELNKAAYRKIPYSGPSATIRNTAYQAHLQDVWDTMIKLNKPANMDNAACSALRDEVIAEFGCNGGHCLDYRPGDYSNHSKGTAFDVPRKTINGLLDNLTPLPPAPMAPRQKIKAQRVWVADWLKKPASCYLNWGGNFNDPDRVHFELP